MGKVRGFITEIDNLRGKYKEEANRFFRELDQNEELQGLRSQSKEATEAQKRLKILRDQIIKTEKEKREALKLQFQTIGLNFASGLVSLVRDVKQFREDQLQALEDLDIEQDKVKEDFQKGFDRAKDDRLRSYTRARTTAEGNRNTSRGEHRSARRLAETVRANLWNRWRKGG